MKEKDNVQACMYSRKKKACSCVLGNLALGFSLIILCARKECITFSQHGIKEKKGKIPVKDINKPKFLLKIEEIKPSQTKRRS